MKKFPITKEGYIKLKEELNSLKQVQRPNIINRIVEARAFGDLSENAEYSAAKEEQSQIEGKILDLESKLGRAEIIDSSKFSGDKIKFGAEIILLDNDTEEEIKYKIVGEYESKPENQIISIKSPLAQILVGKSVGDIVKFNAPKKIKIYEILSVKY